MIGNQGAGTWGAGGGGGATNWDNFIIVKFLIVMENTPIPFPPILFYFYQRDTKINIC